MPKKLKVVVIGGGPSGLTSLKFLATAHHYYPDLEPIDVKLFEAEDRIGGTFAYRAWRDAELVSSKFLTPFSDFRISDDAPDFLSPEEYVQYLVDYAQHFNLFPYIQCKTAVSSVRRQPNGSKGHVVTTFCRETQKHKEHHCDAVLVCSGLNLTPNIPANIESLVETPTSTLTPTPQRQTRSAAAAAQRRNSSEWTTTSENADFKPDADGVSWVNWVSSQNNPTSFPPRGFRVLHSSEFKNREGTGNEFLRADGSPSTVVVLGAGETGHDIASLAVTNPGVGRVLMCHRGGFFVAPKITPEPVILTIWGIPYPGKRPNKPIDTTIASLFDTAYVPPILQRGQLMWDVYNTWSRWMFTVIAGRPEGFDQWVGAVPPERQHVDSFFLVKSERAIPYLSAPYRGGFWNKIRSFFINIPLLDTKGKVIELAPWPTRVMADNKTGVEILEFPDDGSPESKRLRETNTKLGPVQPDVVIFATGYRREFPFLSGGGEYPTLKECLVRGIYQKIEDGFAYIGFVRPSLGAIPPLSELQAQLYISRLITHHLSPPPSSSEDPHAVPPYELAYAMHPRGTHDIFRTKHGVDHESYAYQLALDMGSAPKASYVLRRYGWRVFFTWAMGPNFNTKFRLVGPWADEETAARIMAGELFAVVSRSGGGVFFLTYTLIPQVFFGLLSLVIMLGSWLGGLFASVFRSEKKGRRE